MTYLELVNAVLIRLREDTITEGSLDANPYYRSIGAHVNDAKERVEDAWNWSGLRGTDEISMFSPIDDVNFLLPNSENSSYVLQGFFYSDTPTANDGYRPIRQITKPAMISLYAKGVDAVTPGEPTDIAVMATDQATGQIRVSVFPPPPPSSTAVIIVNRVSHQDSLTAANPNQRLFVPSLPVYTLATALASRERGEVGGTPTSELFAIADRHLSDAIAQDSALFPNELIWYGGMDRPSRTNHARGR